MIGVMPYSLFVDHKTKQGGIQPTPLNNVGSILAKDLQIKSYKNITPSLQQPIRYFSPHEFGQYLLTFLCPNDVNDTNSFSVVTRDPSPLPQPQSYFSLVMEYIFGLW